MTKKREPGTTKGQQEEQRKKHMPSKLGSRKGRQGTTKEQKNKSKRAWHRKHTTQGHPMEKTPESSRHDHPGRVSRKVPPAKTDPILHREKPATWKPEPEETRVTGAPTEASQILPEGEGPVVAPGEAGTRHLGKAQCKNSK
ncbi:hypothetical protein NDU88_009968 [Pleurodeles waltl]|uniref:Uncharacterized protein n=1 Tax=Pleurodeles waltl TaxID=8319 RepID=A0AAV7PTT4_PLEWA|nr:hypothetical protein NDU88_009968 [Pleurodeles waltl]